MIAPLRAILAGAVDNELIPANPAANLGRVGRKAKKIEPPTLEQVTATIDAASDEFEPVLRVAATLGLRHSEL